MRDVLPWLDELEPTPGVGSDSGTAAGEDPAVAGARAALYRRFGEVGASIRVGGETIDRPTAMNRLATEPDAAARRRLFEALAPVWQAVDGDGGRTSPYRRLLRSSAARWAAHGSPIEANAVALGIPPGTIEGVLLQESSRRGGRSSGPGASSHGTTGYAMGASSRRLDRLIPADRLLALNRRYLAALGADPDGLGDPL